MTKLRQITKKSLIIGLYTYVLGIIVYLILRTIYADRYWWLSLINTFSFYVFLSLLTVLPVALLLKQKQLSLLISILLAIGLIWLSPYFLPKSAYAASNGKTLRVATFNMWGGNPHLDEVAHYFRNLNVDIVAFQENAFVSAQDKLHQLEDIYPYQHMQEWEALLSKYPLIKTDYVVPLTRPNAYVHQRVVINLNGQDIAIYNVHLPCPPCNQPRIDLQAPFFVRMLFAYDDTHRNEELHGLMAVLEKEALPYIVVGDFNMSAQSPSYSEMARLTRDAFREAGSGMGFSWPVAEVAGFPSFIPPLIRIDYIWYSHHFEVVNVEQGPLLGSDHLPLWATLKLKQFNS